MQQAFFQLAGKAIQQGLDRFMRRLLRQNLTQIIIKLMVTGDAAQAHVVIHQGLGLVVGGTQIFRRAKIRMGFQRIRIEHHAIAIKDDAFVFF